MYIQYLKKLKDFTQRGIELVTSNDYKDLLDFLSGITTTSARVSSINSKERAYKHRCGTSLPPKKQNSSFVLLKHTCQFAIALVLL